MTTPRTLDRLRPDLQILRTGPRAFRLFDPRSGAHYELGAQERYLLELLQTCDTQQELCEAYARKYGQPLSLRECQEFLEQLRRQCLVVGSESGQPPVGDEIPH